MYEIKKISKVGVNSITHAKQLDCVKKLLNIAESTSKIISVLDCPSGYGRLTELLKKYKLTCADSSRERVEYAESILSGANIEYKHCDIFKMPFDDSSFDVILTMLLLQHIKKEDLPTLFQELSRVTKKWCIISYSSKFSLFSIKRMLNPKNNKHTLTKSEFSEICDEAGFKIIKEMHTIPFIAATKIVLLQK